MKIIFDTHVLLSALISHGLSSRVLDLCIDYHQIFISPWIINEISIKLSKKFKVKSSEVTRAKEFLLTISKQIIPKGKLPNIYMDKDDNKVLHLAEFINADVIITEDKDLLVLKKHNNTAIIKPRVFMETFLIVNL